MALDPITAIADAGKTILNKFVRDKMSEKEAAELENNFELELRREANKESSSFRDFVVAYEGSAKDYTKIPFIGSIILLVRGLIRPAFTILVGYLDWLYFTEASGWSVEQSGLLKAVNLIVLVFWFGERAVQNSGVMGLLTTVISKKADK